MDAIDKFADNTTVVGWISNNEESKYRREIKGLVTWCNENILSVISAKLIIDFRKKGGEHTPIYINGTEVDRAESIKFLRVTITNDLQLRKFGRSLTNFYRRTTESILSRCITAWFGNCSAQDRKKLQKVVCTAQIITETNLPSMDSIYTARCR
eukprot:g41126.t1